ncbi:MAG: LacI family DNA-binding transcriptional regulator [Candidatus Omnitrophota bacterium]|nr:LacI family DNA-binding transcriptional regulator [Candidatus Omnitrophota bacterium]MDZ4243271.1 LacI family DNA-binding transcriptional regulator [Candidatus Omnitrophota bacterium]
MPKKPKNISIEDVARRAKVSITTVSRVLNNIPTVSKDNQSRVEEAIAHLKFKPNVSAQRLATGVTNALGLVMPGYPGIFHSFYAVEIIRGIGHSCEILKLDLVFHITNGLNPINTNSVGGIIFADIIENRKQVEAALDAGISCMVINNIVEDLPVSYIGIDNLAGGFAAAEYLINLGHTRVATVTGNTQQQAGGQRLEGYKKALKKNNIPLNNDYIVEGDYSRRSARAAAEKLLAMPQPPTAIFVASDDMAMEIVAYALEKGMKVPDDLSIIGFDDNPICLYGPVALTTMKQPLFEMAEESVKQLNAIMTGKKKAPAKTVLSPQLVMRESCAPPKK